MSSKSFALWWFALPKSSKISIAVTSTLLLIAIPLSVYTTGQEVKVSPKAYQTIGLNGSRANLIFGGETETINCTLNTPCKVNFEGEAKKLTNPLAMTFDFLPQGLNPGLCLPLKTDTQNRLTCGFEGTPTKTGRYQIQISLQDGKQTKTSTYTLQIR